MKGYCLFNNIQVHSPEKLEVYKNRVAPVVEKFGGKYIILGDRFCVVEGNWKPSFLVMIEFPSYEKATQWYHSEEYAELKAIRQSAVDCNGIIVEGI